MISLMDIEPISVRDFDQAVAAEVRAAMARHGLNISAAAAEIHMRRASFTERYHGRRPFAPSELRKVAALLGATASEIIARAEDESLANAS